MASVTGGKTALDTGTNVVSYVRREFLNFTKDLMGKAGRGGEREVVGISEFARDAMRSIADAYKCSTIKDLLDKANKYLDEQVNALKDLGYEIVINNIFITLTRLAIGLRNPYFEILEQGISWDPIMNLPYIPASSLKGAMRASAEGTQCSQAFGSMDEASHVIVLDSYPVYCPSGKSLMTLDIINPHYAEPARTIAEPQVKPVPVPFLTVSTGVGFRVIIMAERRRLKYRCRNEPGDYIYLSSDCKGVCTINDLQSIVTKVFSRGIGAKTALGYGILEQQRH
ncbi:type III-B CRISPR module RAMP protein Cmr6 [Caldivirga maquilingensis]|uniref:CRISPR-associated RAMP protein, Cmr6 family n=1 Tax=Caldivirga maquilingensis (strain ATCC 700844 / DSM 13496 / JCM 10307 / IC-167) TaxID=397948 RepID=A8M9B9_CALMQ|nr:type III-B CRISPR module RAMP protein Cmr6 [Caldivirga maquilingensis]ABW02338.1 CRISPR-associated RAMP protein, Cmr6 family [Caldivirga maquilingensis IC-167]